MVATAPTVYGIETLKFAFLFLLYKLQQHLPFTVLKLSDILNGHIRTIQDVATAPTVYGIETDSTTSVQHSSSWSCNSTYRLRYWNFKNTFIFIISFSVATAPTVYGIETSSYPLDITSLTKVATAPTVYGIETSPIIRIVSIDFPGVATAPTVYGIETASAAPLNRGVISTVATAPTVYGIETVT